MSRVKGKDTKPEMAVRRMVHGMGYRYRLHAKDLPGHPDIVFRPRKKAIFVHGCFWHRHPKCKLARLPKSKKYFWISKLTQNQERDIRNQRKLADLGWHFLVIWECEIKDKLELRSRIVEFLDNVGE